MRLDVKAAELIGPGGYVQYFPLVCPHCSKCYWYIPSETYPPQAEQSECMQAIMADWNAGNENVANAFWKALVRQERKAGREEALAP